jgi:hypothetical protein
MGGNYDFVEGKTAYNPAEPDTWWNTDQEPALYPVQRNARAEERAEDRARVSAALHAAAWSAKAGWGALATSGDPPTASAIEAARVACIRTTEHLTRVADEQPLVAGVGEAYTDAYANVMLLLDAIAQPTLPIPEAAAAGEALLKIEPPRGHTAGAPWPWTPR